MYGDISIGGVVGGGKTHWGLGGRQKDSQPHKGQILDYGTGGERASAFAFFICFAAFTALLNSVFFCIYSVVVAAKSVAIEKICPWQL